jgi:DME family drug/metabolite transporter
MPRKRSIPSRQRAQEELPGLNLPPDSPPYDLDGTAQSAAASGRAAARNSAIIAPQMAALNALYSDLRSERGYVDRLPRFRDAKHDVDGSSDRGRLRPIDVSHHFLAAQTRDNMIAARGPRPFVAWPAFCPAAGRRTTCPTERPTVHPCSLDERAGGCQNRHMKSPPPEPQHPHPRPSLATARLMVLAAAVLWSTSGLFAKAPHFQGWPGPLLAFWRAAFACLVLFPLVRRPQWTWRLVPAVATFALMNFTYLSAMASTAKGAAANAIWLQSTAPLWVLMAGVFAFRERAVLRDWLLVLFCLAGIGVILANGLRSGARDAVLFGIASGVFYAGVVLSLRQLRDLESAWIVALNHLVTAIVLAPYLFAWEGGRPTLNEFWPQGIQWPLLIGFGVLQMGLPYVLFARSLKTIPGHQASGIGLVEPLLMPIWVWLAWRDVPAWWTLAGGGLIFAGLVLRYVWSAEDEAIPPPA